MLVPIKINIGKLRKVRSPQIVQEFLDQDIRSAKIDLEKVNRTDESVYSSLVQYLQRHPELKVGVTKQDKDIILYRYEDQ